jgi:alanine transaminase
MKLTMHKIITVLIWLAGLSHSRRVQTSSAALNSSEHAATPGQQHLLSALATLLHAHSSAPSAAQPSFPDVRVFASANVSRSLRIRGGARKKEKALEVASMNPNLRDLEYAVRGAIPDRAAEIDAIIKANPDGHGFPFNKTIQCNIGNPQALGQKPLSFNRQVLSLVSNPELLEAAEAGDGTLDALFKKDAVKRARKYLTRDPAGVGAYTNSQGFQVVREEIASFISARDGHPSSPENIFVTDGASSGVKMAYTALIRAGQNDGILIPIPQYPLYSALTTLADGELVGYYLDESSGWGVTVSELRRAIKEARAKGTNVRALVIINPGNPTGQCLKASEMRQIIDFCMKENLVLLADEVYQENVYNSGKRFTSFKKVAMDMRADVELISYHSASKGFIGECGIRGGYLELHNIDPAVKAMLYKLASISLCSNTNGQISIGLMVNPPAKGDESYENYIQERDGILESLKRRAIKLADALNKLEGVTCNPAEGAMYVFPQIRLPKGAVQAAEEESLPPDTFYCLKLLEATGITTVPGTGFKQKDGTFHLRTTFLPSEQEMDVVVERITRFHADFMTRYSDL